MASWLRPDSFDKAKAAAELGGTADGRFVVWPRKADQSGDYVIAVVYRGKPTFHLVEGSDDGNLLVGKKNYGDASTINELVDLLSSGRATKWPVQLIAAGKAAVSDDGESGGDEGGDGPEMWLHNNITSTAEAQKTLLAGGTDNGTFLVYRRGNTEDHAICLMYKGKPTNHLITKNDSGEMTVNKKAWGHVRTLQAVINFLQKPQQGWPQRLAYAVKPASGVNTNDDTAQKEAAQKAAAAEEREKARQKREAEEAAAKAEAEAVKAREEAAARAREEAAAKERERAAQAKAEEERAAELRRLQAEADARKQVEAEEKAERDAANAAAAAAATVTAAEVTSHMPISAVSNPSAYMQVTGAGVQPPNVLNANVSQMPAAQQQAQAAVEYKSSVPGNQYAGLPGNPYAMVMPPDSTTVPSAAASGAILNGYEVMDKIFSHHQMQQEQHDLAAKAVEVAAAQHKQEMARYQEQMSHQIRMMQEQHRAQLEQQALQAQLLADRAVQEAELRNQQQTYQVLSPRKSRTIDDDAATVVSMRSSASKATVGWETRGRRSSKQSPDKAEKKRRQKEAMTALERKEKELLGKLKPRKSLPLSPTSVYDGNLESQVKVVSTEGLYVTKGGHIERDGNFAYSAPDSEA